MSCSPALGGARGWRRLKNAGALTGRGLLSLADLDPSVDLFLVVSRRLRVAKSLEGVVRNFPWVKRYVFVACMQLVGRNTLLVFFSFMATELVTQFVWYVVLVDSWCSEWT